MPQVVQEDEDSYWVQADDGSLAQVAKGDTAKQLLADIGAPMADPSVQQAIGDIVAQPMADPGEGPVGVPPLAAPTGLESKIDTVPVSPSAGVMPDAGTGSVPVPSTSPTMGMGPSQPEDAAGGMGPVGAPPPSVAAQVAQPSSMPVTPTATQPKPMTPTMLGQPAHTPGSEISKEERQILDAEQEKKDAQQGLNDLAEKRTWMTIAQAEGEAEGQRQIAAGMKKRAEDQEKKINGEVGKLQALQKEKADFKVDPDHVWKEKGVGARIVAIIGQALGAFGASMTGGPNYAQQAIDDLINRDILAQKAELEKKGDGIDEQRNTIALMRQQGFDDAQSEMGAHIVGLQAAKAKVAASIAADAPEEVRLRGQQIMADMDAQIAAKTMAFKQATTQKISLSDQIRLAQFNLDQDKDKRERMVRMPDGSTAVAPTPKDATDIKTSEQNRLAMSTNIDRLIQITQDNAFWDGKEMDEAERIAEDLYTQFGVMRGLGALSKDDLKLAEQFRKPSAWTRDSKIVDSLSKYKGRVNAGHNAMLTSRMVTR